jgi:hypothetical protein
MNNFYRRPIILGLLGATTEILESIVELSFRTLATGNMLTLPILNSLKGNNISEMSKYSSLYLAYIKNPLILGKWRKM